MGTTKTGMYTLKCFT